MIASTVFSPRSKQGPDPPPPLPRPEQGQDPPPPLSWPKHDRNRRHHLFSPSPMRHGGSATVEVGVRAASPVKAFAGDGLPGAASKGRPPPSPARRSAPPACAPSPWVNAAPPLDPPMGRATGARFACERGRGDASATGSALGDPHAQCRVPPSPCSPLAAAHFLLAFCPSCRFSSAGSPTSPPSGNAGANGRDRAWEDGDGVVQHCWETCSF
jgi:hypothetical protein